MYKFDTLDRSQTNSAKWEGPRHKVGRDDYLVFSVADSDYETAPEIKKALKERVDHGAFGYTLAGDGYIEAVQTWMENRHHVSVKKPWIVPAPKVLTSMSMMIEAFTGADDKIAIQTPVYHVFFDVVKLSGRKLVENPLDDENGYAMDYAHLERCFQDGVKMLFLCSPHNPVGRVWKKEELQKLVELCKAYDVYLVSDEIHADLILPGHTFVSAGTFFEDYENILVVNAPSKTFNIAGLHAANVVVSTPALRRTLKATMRKFFIGTPNALALTACQTAYEQCDAWVDAQNEHIRANYELTKSFFEENVPEAKVSDLQGTYLLWIDLRAFNVKGKDIYEGLMAHGIVVGEGKRYGVQCDGFIRVNLACSKAQLLEGLRRMDTYFETLRT